MAALWDRGRWDGCGPDVCGVHCARWGFIPEGVVCIQGPCGGPRDVGGPPEDQGPSKMGSDGWIVRSWNLTLLALVTLWTLLGVVLMGPSVKEDPAGKGPGHCESPCPCCRAVGSAPELGALARDEWVGAQRYWGWGLGPGGAKERATPGCGGRVYASQGAVKDAASQGGWDLVCAPLGVVKDGASPGRGGSVYAPLGVVKDGAPPSGGGLAGTSLGVVKDGEVGVSAKEMVGAVKDCEGGVSWKIYFRKKFLVKFPILGCGIEVAQNLFLETFWEMLLWEFPRLDSP